MTDTHPPRALNDAHTIARLITEGDKVAASKAFDEVCLKQKLKKFEVIMFRDMVFNFNRSNKS